MLMQTRTSKTLTRKCLILALVCIHNINTYIIIIIINNYNYYYSKISFFCNSRTACCTCLLYCVDGVCVIMVIVGVMSSDVPEDEDDDYEENFESSRYKLL